ncbi:hypothetical protein A3A54_01705 [Candidatus Curtissbacteria bacterium RIFCSPLOWO2_01_FULL_39_62]|uniref:Transmembrane protein n=2 Tax=Candidatus Curtissiibacteriota TaxID=1752717 RepID=A0A1F5GBU6_9BACT|nr:MAG: hypothetical protein A2775_00530 [Candidatus Curtissbacteria bacterium RIFCSPHIGHO2_01_FULL_39_57]OGD89363.1 MAG: hypothetical protein A3D04_03940 [Candidatus Curtissbacteria bacterium RIFCSPHIGHO2_02_FULL_40_16b]OGE01036.1 MAG: hypothetical protein A3J17_03555 [Candidatus Curtissbacteria bacterium RIFCSPLOWO2_02_FULL_40_11]OGE02732.1 MAG: hypothetical protein A3A54_01705 [Candidatus Curtissbacteria bacterium RIFCSPLOWO2_01_FULL_39_62]OGE12332.1 MAG: hypothetical protein A3G14_02220 [Ca
MKSGFSIFLLILFLSGLTIGTIFVVNYYFDNNQEKGIQSNNTQEETDYLVSGEFTINANDADVKDFQEQMNVLQAEVYIMESHPMKFQIYVLTYNECYRIKDIFDFAAYIETVQCNKL